MHAVEYSHNREYTSSMNLLLEQSMGKAPCTARSKGIVDFRTSLRLSTARHVAMLLCGCGEDSEAVGGQQYRIRVSTLSVYM